MAAQRRTTKVGTLLQCTMRSVSHPVGLWGEEARDDQIQTKCDSAGRHLRHCTVTGRAVVHMHTYGDQQAHMAWVWYCLQSCRLTQQVGEAGCKHCAVCHAGCRIQQDAAASTLKGMHVPLGNRHALHWNLGWGSRVCAGATAASRLWTISLALACEGNTSHHYTL